MEIRTTVELDSLNLPDALSRRLSNASLYESSGASGARTVFVDLDGGMYLKIAERGSLESAAVMQAYFAKKSMAPPVLHYVSDDRDYLLSAALPGLDGTHPAHLAKPERLCRIFGEALRTLHEIDAPDCPVPDRMRGLLNYAQNAPFRQDHLDAVSAAIGSISAHEAAAELRSTCSFLENDALLHGDYCLPNILIHNWAFAGFIDVADGGFGDRHYDLAWGLWTLSHNLRSQEYSSLFLDAYGRDKIDSARLRACALLMAID